MATERERIKLLKQDILNVRRAFEDFESGALSTIGHECSQQCAVQPDALFGRLLEEQLQQHHTSCQSLYEFWELAICSLLQASLFKFQQQLRIKHAPPPPPRPIKSSMANTYVRNSTPPNGASSSMRLARTEAKGFHPFANPQFNYNPTPPHPLPAKTRRFVGRREPDTFLGKTQPRHCALSALVYLLAEVASLQQSLALSNRRLQETQTMVIELKHSHARAEYERPKTVDKLDTINNLNLEVERLETVLAKALADHESALKAKDALEGKYRTLREVQDAQYSRDLKSVETEARSEIEQIQTNFANRRAEIEMIVKQANERLEEEVRLRQEWQQKEQGGRKDLEQLRLSSVAMQARLDQLQQTMVRDGGEASDEIKKLRKQLQETHGAKIKLEFRNKELKVTLEEYQKGKQSSESESSKKAALSDARLSRAERDLKKAHAEITDLKAMIKALQDREHLNKKREAEAAVEAAKKKAARQKAKETDDRRKAEEERARLAKRAEEREMAKRKENEEKERMKLEEEKKAEEKKLKREQEKKRRAAARAENARKKALAEAEKQKQAKLEKEAAAAREEMEKLEEERKAKELEKKKKKKNKRKAKKEAEAKPPSPKKISSGYGKCIYGPGEWYEGYWEDYERHGKGVYHWADGRQYEGEWSRDKKHGKGSYTWVDGDRYEGDYHDDKMHGQGTYYFSDGTRYEGAWERDMSHGKGKFLYHDGAKFEGMFDADRKHGPGVMKHVSGEVFEEKWHFGKCIKSTRVGAKAKRPGGKK